MSTLRKLRRAMVTQQAIGGSQKPRGKIADLPEDGRRLMRCLIRDDVEQRNLIQKVGGTADKAAQAVEDLIDVGILKISIKNPEETLARDGGLQYEIVPTGKY